MTQQDLLLLREQLGTILLGTVFCFVALVALAVAAIRRRRAFLVILWFGCFIGMYGMLLLSQATVALSMPPRSSWPERVDVFVTYMLVVPGTLFMGGAHAWLASPLSLVVGRDGIRVWSRRAGLLRYDRKARQAATPQ